jgi:hypothetical protein
MKRPVLGRFVDPFSTVNYSVSAVIEVPRQGNALITFVSTGCSREHENINIRAEVADVATLVFWSDHFAVDLKYLTDPRRDVTYYSLHDFHFAIKDGKRTVDFQCAERGLWLNEKGEYDEQDYNEMIDHIDDITPDVFKEYFVRCVNKIEAWSRCDGKPIFDKEKIIEQFDLLLKCQDYLRSHPEAIKELLAQFLSKRLELYRRQYARELQKQQECLDCVKQW